MGRRRDPGLTRAKRLPALSRADREKVAEALRNLDEGPSPYFPTAVDCGEPAAADALRSAREVLAEIDRKG